MPRLGSGVWAAIRIAAAVVVVAVLLRAVIPQWPAIVEAWHAAVFRPLPLVASALAVLASYAVLIETWRRVVGALGGRLAYMTAARIWLVSNLAKFVPGRVWSIAAMGALSHQAGVSPLAAVGSSLLITLVNILAGLVVVLGTSSDALALPPYAKVTVVVLALVVVAWPRMLHAVARWGAARTGKPFDWPMLPAGAMLAAFVGCVLGWVLQGLAFQLLVAGSVTGATGASSLYIAVYTASYIAGFLFLLTPGGLGVREFVLAGLLARFGMATVGTAAVIVLISRLWLTVIELLPGLFLLAFTPKPASSPVNDPD